ncbi:MAG: hypothetical protein OM95_12155 [Bdellovibrio sp. ArHS]|uniref:hypothetical protein n=1 Tax=Bdellovibrio sp. ArHS TaxID=1569284 RepID=UPI00058367B1|nr:hypothetical protein [Bdellovibrio sp. ArHS]KHD87762.1 MAG: hypothetical protein OM95_12155 [Bdellovibrio sp. ArHS]
MDVLVFSLSLLVFILGLAIFANRARARQELPFELQPNCLLTRWPLLFVTGPRSLFYFSKYWNIYTVFLAEHGYEVFTLHLPWKNTEQRQERFRHFLEQQEKSQRRFHLVVDAPTMAEFSDLLASRRSPSVISITELADLGVEDPRVLSLKAYPIPKEVLEFPHRPATPLLELSYSLHRQSAKNKKLPSLNVLGANTKTALENSQRLLTRAQTLAEMDLRDSL